MIEFNGSGHGQMLTCTLTFVKKKEEGEEERVGGIACGVFLSFFLAIGAPYGNMIIRGSYMALDFSTPGAIFLFLVMIFLDFILFIVL